jgi:hypothetical protein
MVEVSLMAIGKYLSSYKILVTGAVMGLAAAAVQAYLSVQPEANGISLIGHPADLLNWATNKLGTSFPVSEEFLKYPALTVAGVLIGSLIGASRNKELRLQMGPVRRRFDAIAFGFLVANFGLLLGSCDIRVALLVSYGSALAAVGLAALVVGILLAIVYSRIKARKVLVVQ